MRTFNAADIEITLPNGREAIILEGSLDFYDADGEWEPMHGSEVFLLATYDDAEPIRLRIPTNSPILRPVWRDLCDREPA